MLATCLLAIATQLPADTLSRGSVRGVVQSQRSGLPVSAAVVEVGDSSRLFRSLSDSLGLYRLAGLIPGRHRVRVRHLEHEPLELEITVSGGGELVMDLALRYRPVELDTVRAAASSMGGAGDTSVAQPGDLARAESQGGSGNPAGGTVMPLPGEPSPDDELQVRGSAADLRLVLLDGAPVYAPFHMGGLLEAFEPATLGAARLHLAGAPARYDGGLSYVMELATRAGNGEAHVARGSVDMVAVRAVAEGPLGGGMTYLASGRAVHGATLGQLEGDPFPYEFRDGLLRLDLPVRSGHLRATAFGNHEAVRMSPEADATGFAWWRSGAGSLRYNGTLLGVPAEATLAYSDFSAAIPQRRTYPLEGSTRRVRAALELSRTRGPLRIRYGGSYDAMSIQNEVRVPELGSLQVVSTQLGGGAAAVYGDAIWQTTPSLVLRAGGRMDVFSERVAVTASPRFAATWLVGDRAALTVAAGRFHQYLRARPASATLGPGSTLADSAAFALAGELRVAGASHLSISLDQQMNEGVRLGVEGFYKRFSGIPGARGVATHNSGFDVWARRALGPLSGWVGYNLGWTWAEGDTSALDFSGRHVLSAGASGALGRRGKLAVRLQFGGPLPTGSLLGNNSGAPGDPLAGGDEEGGFTEEAGDLEVDAPILGSNSGREYVRLDAQLSRTWAPRLAGRRTELTPYLRVINALDRRDPLFYRYGAGGTTPEPVGTLPLLPVLGLDWRF